MRRALVAAGALALALGLAACGGNACEWYRWSPQKDVPVNCVQYLQQNP